MFHLKCLFLLHLKHSLGTSAAARSLTFHADTDFQNLRMPGKSTAPFCLTVCCRCPGHYCMCQACLEQGTWSPCCSGALAMATWHINASHDVPVHGYIIWCSRCRAPHLFSVGVGRAGSSLLCRLAFLVFVSSKYWQNRPADLTKQVRPPVLRTLHWPCHRVD